MPKAKLTKKYIDRLEPDEREIVYWDTSMPGFGLRVRPNARKVFIVQFRTIEGRTRKMTLGPFGRLTLEEARKLARRALSQVDAGNDPAEERDRLRQAITIRDLAHRYLEEHAKVKKKPHSYNRDERLVERFVLPSLGRKHIDTLKRADVVRMHHRVGQDTPIQANRTLAVLSKMMTLAIRWGLRTDETNPCRYVERFKENQRDRYLKAEELARLGKVLSEAEAKGTGSPSSINAIRLLLFTGARLGEVLGIRWEWVDFEHGCLRLPDSKTGAKTVPLGEPALDLLGLIPRLAGNPHVLPGQKFGRPITNIDSTWRKIRTAAGLEGVRLHDLRHSFASVGASAGLGLPIIGALLGHSEAATTQRYFHLAQDPLKQAADQIAGEIARALEAPVKEKVVSLKPNK